MSVTGCLQKGPTEFIVTEINSPAGPPVGTSGSRSRNGQVARDHIREAAHAYTLGGDHGLLSPLLGRQVRIVGTLAEDGKLHAPGARVETPRWRSGADPAIGTTGVTASERETLNEEDLMKLEVVSIEQVASSCGRQATTPRR
jgi:hypothetical protein